MLSCECRVLESAWFGFPLAQPSEMSVRHQCLVYEGSPSRHLEAIAACIKRRLDENYRCLYLNSKPMVAGLRSYLAALGVDVAEECARTSLVLSSDASHLGRSGVFNIDRMLRLLETALDEALRDNFSGLFASGDMTWEFGPRKDYSKLLEYEWRLERLFREHPQLAAVCQYHIDTLPREALRTGTIFHETIFVDETLCVPNPNYIQNAGLAARFKDAHRESLIALLEQAD